MGNHEHMLLDAACAGYDQDFFHNGGLLTLESFCVQPNEIPKEYIDFIADLPYSAEDERRFYVHAGIDPTRPLNAQREYDMLWIRERFLECTFPFEKYIVHGHTPTDQFDVDVRPNRCNVDAGCYASGRLVCAVFDDTQDQPIDRLMVTPNARRVI